MSTTSKQLDCLTGMRGASAIIVVLGHCIRYGVSVFRLTPAFESAASVSVAFFFVLSAFLLTYKAFCEILPPPKILQDTNSNSSSRSSGTSIGTEPKEDTTPYPTVTLPEKASLLYYLIRRLFRIYPAYFIALLLPKITPDSTSWEFTWKRMLFLNTTYDHLWTVRIELLYYLLIPVLQILCALAIKLENKNRTPKIPFLALLLSVITSLAIWVHAAGYPIGKHLPTFWYGSLAGIAYFFCKKNGYILTNPKGRKQKLMFATIEIVTYGLLICMILANQVSSEALVGKDTWLSLSSDGPYRASFGLIFAPFIFLVAVTDGNTSLAKFFTNNFLVWSGKISYSIYLIQCIPIYIIAYHTNVRAIEATILVMILVCAMGWALNVIVEGSGIKIGNWLTDKLKSQFKKVKIQTQEKIQDKVILIDTSSPSTPPRSADSQVVSPL